MIFTREEKQNWSLLNKIGFRFAFIYFTFYCFCIIGSGLFKPLVYWVGEDILNISYNFSSRGYGSGDTTFQYVLLLIILVTSIFGTIIWSIFDRRKSYNQLNYSLTLLLRLTLVAFMFIYGFIKVFHLQMPPPSYTRLMQTVGEMSPMGLAWTFMGYSQAYSIFAGASEVIAGLLLISRRLQTIGSIMVIAVMGNVFMMNMAFDIPVKIFSFHLMMMGVYLFLSNGNRFVKSVILRQAVSKEESYPVHSKEAKKGIRIAKGIITLLLLGGILLTGFTRFSKFEEMKKPFLGGVWEVDTYQKNGVVQPPLTTDTERWRYFIVDYEGFISIKKMDDKIIRYFSEINKLDNSIALGEIKDVFDLKFTYTLNNSTIELIGTHENDNIRIQMHKKDEKDFTLTNRKFHWINESPNNQ